MFDLSGWSVTLPYGLLALAVGYAFGSIPFGLVLTRVAGTADIRTIGSGNIGATNVLRTGRRGLAAATLAFDMLKGTAAVLLLALLLGRDYGLVAGLGSFIGHLFPVWLRFKGGKGVATFIGVLLGAAPSLALAFAVLWAGVAAVTRYSSLAGLLASLGVVVLAWVSGERQVAQLVTLLTVLIVIMHRQNIARLLQGTESKIGSGAGKAGK